MFGVLATQPKSLLNFARRVSPESRRIAQLADQPELAEAQRWLVRERQWVNEQHVALCRVRAYLFRRAAGQLACRAVPALRLGNHARSCRKRPGVVA